jgi:hypothetical protein
MQVKLYHIQEAIAGGIFYSGIKVSGKQVIREQGFGGQYSILVY